MTLQKNCKTIILASASTARRELLKRAGIHFVIVPSHVSELRGRGRTLRQTVLANAARKAAAIAKRHPARWVLAADTMISFEGRIYGKPASRRDAIDFLTRSAGKVHVLGTGVVLRNGRRKIECYEESRIVLKPLTRAAIARTLSQLDPTRFAGGYCVKVRDPLIARIEGSFTNVVGLPMEKVIPLIRRVCR